MSELNDPIPAEEVTDIIIRSLVATIDALEHRIDALGQERGALRAHLDRESAELTAVYDGNHADRLRDLQLQVEHIIRWTEVPNHVRTKLETALAASRMRPDDPN